LIREGQRQECAVQVNLNTDDNELYGRTAKQKIEKTGLGF
jgi:hypothetical protein